MTHPPRPSFFGLLALWFGFRSVVRFGGLLGTPPDWSDPASLVLRFVTACAIVACGVAAVALWRVKRWGHMPVGAWVATAAAHGFVTGVAEVDATGAPVAGAFFGALVPFLVYLHVRSQLLDLYPPPPLPRSAVVPAPLPNPARVPPPPRPRAGLRLPRP